jgi:hypothetical protein
MPPEATETPAVEKTETASELFTRLKAAKSADAAKPVEELATEGAAAPVVEKRASGDERKFRRQLSKRDQEIGALRAEIDALKPKPAADASSAAAVTADKAPKREDFAAGAAGDELFADAKTAHTVQKAIDRKAAEDAQTAERKAIIDGYNERMAAAPAKYPDWAEVMAAAEADPKGQALKGDIGKECPILFMAIAQSRHNDDLFYTFMKEPAKLQALIDTYKSGPNGPMEARDALLRLEGRVGKDAKAAAKEPAPKADDAVVKVPKPKPSSEAAVRGGTAAPDGKPAIYLPGTHTLNPAYKVWQRQQRGA